mmetsp:Transcript_400/g.998  ORF Transcript_400/g.998 Transcript_400/m.998 type:complete len:293 (-) Transcript_400:88-966(-)
MQVKVREERLHLFMCLHHGQVGVRGRRALHQTPVELVLVQALIMLRTARATLLLAAELKERRGLLAREQRVPEPEVFAEPQKVGQPKLVPYAPALVCSGERVEHHCQRRLVLRHHVPHFTRQIPTLRLARVRSGARLAGLGYPRRSLSPLRAGRLGLGRLRLRLSLSLRPLLVRRGLLHSVLRRGRPVVVFVLRLLLRLLLRLRCCSRCGSLGWAPPLCAGPSAALVLRTADITSPRSRHVRVCMGSSTCRRQLSSFLFLKRLALLFHHQLLRILLNFRAVVRWAHPGTPFE